jgi:ABC-type multidrug transport system fused ATPase/permease subunit
LTSFPTSNLGVWKKAWNLLDSAEKRRARWMLFVVVLAALSSAFMVVSIFPFLAVLADRDTIQRNSSLLWLYETFGFQSDYAFLVALGIGSFLVIALSNLIQMLKTYLVLQFTNMLTYSVSIRLLERYLRSGYVYFLNNHTTKLNKTILTESSQIVANFFRPASELIASTLAALAIVTVVIWVDPVIALIALLMLGGSYGAIFLWSRAFLDRLGSARIQHNGARFRIVGEAFGGIKSMKITGREHQTLERYHGPSLAMADVQVKANVVSSLPQFVVQSVAFGGIIVVCLLLVDRARYEQGAALGELLPLIGVFAFAGQRILPELGKLYGSATKLAFGASVVRHVTQELAQMRDLPPLPESIPPGLGLSRELRFEGVSYSYPNTTDRGLRDVSLTIRAGERIGIVGSTGAGKTTLADITLGLLRPQAGVLRADDTVITEDNLRAWQQSLGYVPQEIFLTDSSIASNIALGIAPEQVDTARVEDCAKRAQLHEFILSDLPEGYATPVGERGVRLSGGQRQRLGIARALYHNAELIVFDEATSALDNATERDVMSAIDALPGDKTILLIAHRLSTVRNCDRIIVLDKGRLAGFAPWDDLMAENDTFQRIASVHPTT